MLTVRDLCSLQEETLHVYACQTSREPDAITRSYEHQWSKVLHVYQSDSTFKQRQKVTLINTCKQTIHINFSRAKAGDWCSKCGEKFSKSKSDHKHM